MHGKDYQPVPYRPERMAEPDALRISRELRERMDQRRSVRRFSTEPVPEQLVLDAISVAATAPSGSRGPSCW